MNTTDVVVKVKADANAVNINETLDNQIELLFTPENFNRPDEVRVTISSDSTVTQFEITHDDYSRDARFNGLVVDNIAVNVVQE